MSMLASTFEGDPTAPDQLAAPALNALETPEFEFDLPEPGVSLLRWSRGFLADHSLSEYKELAASCSLNDGEQFTLVKEIQAAHGNVLETEADSADRQFAQASLESLKHQLMLGNLNTALEAVMAQKKAGNKIATKALIETANSLVQRWIKHEFSTPQKSQNAPIFPRDIIRYDCLDEGLQNYSRKQARARRLAAKAINAQQVKPEITSAETTPSDEALLNQVAPETDDSQSQAEVAELEAPVQTTPEAAKKKKIYPLREMVASDYAKHPRIRRDYRRRLKPIHQTYHQDDPLGDYLQSINKFQLLDKQREAELGYQIQTGIAEWKKRQNGEDFDESKLIDAICAFHEFFESNLKLVVFVASRMKSKVMNGPDIIDKVTWGNFGLFSAIEKFDPDKGYKFSTYATWWIRQAIEREAPNNLLIRLPVHEYDALAMLKKVEGALSRDGAAPSEEEIAAAMHITPAKLKELRHTQRQYIRSLDEPLDMNGKEVSLHEKVGDPNANKDSDEWTDRVSLLEDLESLRGYLTEREMAILLGRLAIGPAGTMEKARTLDEIGADFNLTRERIRQIETKVYIKIARRELFPRLVERCGLDSVEEDAFRHYFMHNVLQSTYQAIGRGRPSKVDQGKNTNLLVSNQVADILELTFGADRIGTVIDNILNDPKMLRIHGEETLRKMANILDMRFGMRPVPTEAAARSLIKNATMATARHQLETEVLRRLLALPKN